MTRWSCLLALSVALMSCKQGGDDKDKDKGDDKAAKDKDEGDDKGDKGEDEGEASLVVAEGDDNVDGPVPPESSMVLFAIEGALLPVACFDKDAKAIKSGDACLKLVKEGEMVRLDAGFSSARNKSAGAPTEPQCMAGSGKKDALAVEGLSDANYKYATWPPSGVKVVKLIKEETLESGATDVDDDTRAKILAAINKDAASAKGEVKLNQVAEIDLDGNDKKDVLYSAFIEDPKVMEQFTWSGIFLARDGNMDDMILIDKSKSKKDVFEVRATLDLDGTGPAELWMHLGFADGGGDRLYQFEGDKAKPVGGWTCGA